MFEIPEDWPGPGVEHRRDANRREVLASLTPLLSILGANKRTKKNAGPFTTRCLLLLQQNA
jgi:hypothetical protein